MKKPIDKRPATGVKDFLALGVTTCGVGYIPGAPGTYGSAVGVAIYLLIEWMFLRLNLVGARSIAIISVAFLAFCLLGIWSASRSTELLGDLDPPQAVVDEVIGQLIVFLFVPFSVGWPFVLAGFLLFRLFDIWKPYPIDSLQNLDAGLGVCADDILAGVYAGVCLSIIYAVAI